MEYIAMYGKGLKFTIPTIVRDVYLGIKDTRFLALEVVQIKVIDDIDECDVKVMYIGKDFAGNIYPCLQNDVIPLEVGNGKIL